MTNWENNILHQWFDTHCHLDRFENEAAGSAALLRAKKNGVCRFVVPGVSGSPFEGSSLAKHSEVRFAWGIHPDFCSGRTSCEEIHSISYQPVAIGECGLDKRSQTHLSVQKDLFSAQILLAKQMGLPLIIHLVGHYQLAYDLLSGFSPLPPLIMHSWSGSSEMAGRFIELGACISISAASLKQPDKIRKLLRAVKISDLLLESDCPSMAPEFLAGKKNEPSVVPLFGAILAHYLNIEIAKLSYLIYKNSHKIFSNW